MAFAGAFGRGVSVRSSQPEEALDKLLDSLGFGQPLWSHVLICATLGTASTGRAFSI